MSVCMSVLGIHEHVCIHVSMYVHMCCTGVVYDNISVVFMHWAFSINNKVGLVSFANIY